MTDRRSGAEEGPDRADAGDATPAEELPDLADPDDATPADEVSDHPTGEATVGAAGQRPPGRYRLHEGVRLVDPYVVSVRPLAATRLNEAGLDAVAVLDDGAVRSPDDVAGETGLAAPAVATLFERLHRRGFLAWRAERDPSYRPPVSVVVTVRDDRERLGACLDALAALDYPDVEVVVVDDGSTDGTGEVVAGHPLTAARRLRHVEVGTPAAPLGIGASRNRGVAVADGDVVAFTDADCRPRPDWLADLVPCLAAHDLVGGRVRPAGDGAASAYEAWNSSLDMGPAGARIDPGGRVPYLPTANLLGRREVLAAVGFPERDVAEDVGLCWRALDAGYDVVYEPAGVVEHAYRSTVRPFATRRATYGASEALLAREHGREGHDRVGVPLAALAVGLLGLLAFVTGGLLGTTAAGLGAALAGLVVAARVAEHGRTLRHLAPAVTARDVAASWGRRWLSTAYAVARELARYYALSLALLGGLAWLAGAGLPASLVLAGVALAVLLPLAVELRVYDPRCTPASYAAYYLADHLGYQVGVYRGALAHRTVAHLLPTERFRLTGPGVRALLGGLIGGGATPAAPALGDSSESD